ncbi:hypothetical protein ABK040_004015 [Willaertia magna]
MSSPILSTSFISNEHLVVDNSDSNNKRSITTNTSKTTTSSSTTTTNNHETKHDNGNPILILRKLFYPLYCKIFGNWYDKTNQTDNLFVGAFSFVHFFHSSLGNRWVHFFGLIPFYSGFFITIGSLISLVNYYFLFSQPTSNFQQPSPSSITTNNNNINNIDNSNNNNTTFLIIHSLIISWSIIYNLFIFGIDKYVGICTSIYSFIVLKFTMFILSFFFFFSNNYNYFSLSPSSINNNPSLIIYQTLLLGIVIYLLANLIQLFGHFYFDHKSPAFYYQEAFIITPIYIYLRCILMDNPLLSYEQEWKRKIESLSTEERYHPYKRD